LQAYTRMMRSGDPGASGDAQGEALTGAERATEILTEGGVDEPSEEEVVLLAADGAERSSLANPVREVDRRNGNAARARKQAAKPSEVIEAADGSIHRLKATSLVIPEEKRCKAMTVHGERCKVGKMRGLEVCVFHAHRALSDDALAQIADPEVKPRLSPRAALKAVVALRAEELAGAAVDGALSADGANRTRAVLSLVDATDPLVTEEASITLSREGAQTANWRQLRTIFSPTG
jgi:hypothetical protein